MFVYICPLLPLYACHMHHSFHSHIKIFNKTVFARTNLVISVLGINGKTYHYSNTDEESTNGDYCRLFPDSADPGVGAYR